MILVDANILLYAEDSSSPHHTRSREFWDAALAREYGLTLYSTDSDFSRFPGIRWINPVVP